MAKQQKPAYVQAQEQKKAQARKDVKSGKSPAGNTPNPTRGTPIKKK